MSSKKSYEDRFKEIAERIIAVSATNGDPRPLQKQLQELLKEKEQDEKNAAS